MNWKEKSALSSCRVYLLENIYDVTPLLDDFIEAGLINTDVEDEINVNLTRLARKKAFLAHLETWGPSAFKVFLKSLERNRYDAVVEKLQDELKKIHVNHSGQHGGHNKHTNAAASAPSWLSAPVGRQVVSESFLALLAQDLPPDQLFVLGSVLGQPRARLQHYQAAHPHTPSLQLSAMLCDWRTMHGPRATVETLVGAMTTARVPEEVYRELILDDVGVTTSELINRMDSLAEIASGNSEQWV